MSRETYYDRMKRFGETCNEVRLSMIENDDVPHFVLGAAHIMDTDACQRAIWLPEQWRKA
jgi:hypothetical protein